MTKQSTTPAAATFQVGDRVFITLPQTNEQPALGTITKAASGWFVCLLDEPEEYPLAKNGIVSARKDRMALAAPDEQDDDSGDEQDDDSGDEQDDATHPDDEEAVDEVAQTVAAKMAEALRKARVRYIKDRRPSGSATAHNGDTIARELRDYEPLEVCALCDRCFDLPKGSTAARYENLNNGQKRMNAGNRIRSAFLKGDELLRQRVMFVLGLDADDEQGAE